MRLFIFKRTKKEKESQMVKYMKRGPTSLIIKGKEINTLGYNFSSISWAKIQKFDNTLSAKL